jgi:hypothetical protein
MPVPDNDMKAGIFSGKVVIVDSGKIAFIGHPPNPPPNSLFAVPTKRVTKKRRLAWIFKKND